MSSPILFKLAQFEGPLDLLLHLISKAKIDLQDIFVSEITEQYLSYMEQIEELDMDRASEFLNMAATLLYIKSRSLLPAKREEKEDDDFIDPEEELIERLRAYKLYKEAGERLAGLEGKAKDIYYKLPDELIDMEQELVIEGSDANALYQAFLELLTRRSHRKEQKEQQLEVRQDTFSIRLQKKMILNRIKKDRKIKFCSLFADDASHMEIAVTFVALLELWHIGQLAVRQQQAFSDILLIYQGGID